MTQNKFLSKKIIGITGNSGSGKTTVAKIFATKHGGHAIEADKVAHGVMEPGKPAYNKVVEAFGKEIITNGKINRKKLGAIVFNDIEKRTQLENIVHPLVSEEILNEAESAKAQIVTIDAVLLVESGLHKNCDAVWLIIASEEERLKRIIERDGLSQEAAWARMRNQRDTAHIAAIAQVIIHNNGDLDDLHSQVTRNIEGVR